MPGRASEEGDAARLGVADVGRCAALLFPGVTWFALFGVVR
jgi:hypothetical protein